jgi:sensor histidine kinase YesM
LDGFAYIALIGLAHAGVFHRRYREREQQATLLASRLNEARLHALQAQLQPHFLFNTLNGIATLLRRDPAKAEDMLLSLSELLRIALNSSQRQEIPLREEMDFLGRYLAIQKMRFGDRIEVVEEIEPTAMDCLVPALLLQPLVENAIRHGLEPSVRQGLLRITGSRDGEWLRLTVEDNGVGLEPGVSNCTGVGLANARERLATLHGAAHEFELVEREQGGVAVKIKLPARTETVATENESTPGPPNDPQRSGVSAERRKHSQADASGALPRRRYDHPA